MSSSLQAQEQLTQPYTFPAPTGGINSIMNLYGMDPRDAIITINIDATTYGLKVRPGYNEYANGFAGGAIQTMIPYTGSLDNGSEDKLWAANSDGIYNVSASTTTPVKDVDWLVKNAPAGRCSFSQFTNDGGGHFLLVADEENGLQLYEEATGLWSVPAIVGPTNGAADIVFVMSWKNRMWYIEKNSTSAWYSDVGVFGGTLTEFNFGSRFRYGGILAVLADWTLDSGEGPDDYIVAVSSAGDVIVYSGTDPSSSATFGLIGLWFVGAVPFGRRIISLYGGDMLLLSTYGLISMGALLEGKDPFSLEASLSWKIQAFINTALQATRAQFGWEIKIHPNLSRLVISSPLEAGKPFTQYVYDLNLKAWSIWNDMPMITSEQYKSEMYIGTGATPQVYKVEGTLDNVLLIGGAPLQVDWQILTSYQDMDQPEQFKRMQFMRPIFLAAQKPSYTVRAYYDYDLSPLPSPVNAVPAGIALWDAGIWDLDIWGGGSIPFQPAVGAYGIGRTMAVAIRGRSQVETTLIAVGVMWDTGNLL